MKIPLYHSTNWAGLTSIILDELIRPGAILPADRSHLHLGKLADRNLHFAWFSTQRWSYSRFGAYIFEIDGNELVTSELVPLGKYNGARCYVAAPRMLVRMIAKTLGVTPIDTVTDINWRPQSARDRVDILVPWPVPAGDTIEFTGSARAEDVGCDDNGRHARARFMSTMLLTGCHQFDRALADVDAVGADMLSALLGITSSAFDKRAAVAKANPPPTGTNYLDMALNALVDGDVGAACEAAAHYGTEIAVANKVALVLSKHFSRPVCGHVIHARLP